LPARHAEHSPSFDEKNAILEEKKKRRKKKKKKEKKKQARGSIPDTSMPHFINRDESVNSFVSRRCFE
jgi:hypothetical protein